MNWFEIEYDKSLNNEELFSKAKSGCEESKNLLFQNNIPFIRKVAKRWKAKGISLDVEELISIGGIALLKTYNAYDPESGYKFTTLLGKALTWTFANEVKKVSQLKFNKYPTFSMDDHTGEKETSLHDIVGHEVEMESSKYIDVDLDKLLLRFQKIATEQEKVVLYKTYVENVSLTDLAKEWGKTRALTSLIHRRCIDKLRRMNNIV
ncbi:sigma-70 family RNA polymerase sigma factor [Paenibacillus sp. N1-5-1-14]|uniref:sigma-70 family RNA polymerase sigma factor n=1 Tax=Paenibacillus radicibacter TaxID=2972488 RepID=UPI002158F233|nr:sigma-70 family RNA polymerase sigma factor [Paenibacillus radicibacter]MCR8641380.1 sigma-70 family RNA polymerase sigma factor [Paenibacillus radicibacter]